MDFTKLDNTVCDMCAHKLTDHWSGGCGQDHNSGMVIKCECPRYFPKGENFCELSYSEYSVEDAKLTILRELGY